MGQEEKQRCTTEDRYRRKYAKAAQLGIKRLRNVLILWAFSYAHPLHTDHCYPRQTISTATHATMTHPHEYEHHLAATSRLGYTFHTHPLQTQIGNLLFSTAERGILTLRLHARWKDKREIFLTRYFSSTANYLQEHRPMYAYTKYKYIAGQGGVEW